MAKKLEIFHYSLREATHPDDRIAENEYARKEGREEGREEEKKAIAQKMTKKGIDKETIFDITGIRL